MVQRCHFHSARGAHAHVTDPRLATCVSLAVRVFCWRPSSRRAPRPRARRRRPSSSPQALDASKLEAIAAADPADPQTFVAALYFQGSQILVVSAKYAAPPLLVAKIKEQNYRDVYIDLSSASVAGSKVFVIDAGRRRPVAQAGRRRRGQLRARARSRCSSTATGRRRSCRRRST